MPRLLLVLATVLACGCGGPDALGTPAQPIPVVPADAGADVLDACQSACGDLAHCELRDGGVGSLHCGPLCGETCAEVCAAADCNSGLGWEGAFCAGAASAPRWTSDPTCDDGDPCTTGDRCAHAACGGSKTGSEVDRYVNVGVAAYAYDGPGSDTFSPANGWDLQRRIFRSVPGTHTALHQYFDNVEVDRGLATAGSELGSNYVDQGVVAQVLRDQKGSTVELLRYTFTCTGSSSGLCTGHTRHFFTTSSSDAERPSGSAAHLGLFVCPP